MTTWLLKCFYFYFSYASASKYFYDKNLMRLILKDIVIGIKYSKLKLNLMFKRGCTKNIKLSIFRYH